MKKNTSPLIKILIYLAITFGFTWTLWGSQALYVNNIITHPIIRFFANIYTYGAWGPLIAAILITIIYKGKNGLKSLFTRTFNLQFAKKWLIPTFLLFPLIIGLPLLVIYILGQPIPPLSNMASPIDLPIIFFAILLNSGPLQEEFGWRGILQEQFQKKINALPASLITGFIWGIWHLPFFFIPDQGFYYDKPIWGLILSTTLISVLFGWIYNNTNRNLLLMLIFHTTYNYSHYLLPTLVSNTGGQLYFLFLIVCVTVIIFKYGATLSTQKQ
jgi:membrane protease YdiL (CAAX protease family)